jgi:EmrB/QacA subfamily drug resistance transporter
VDTGTMTELTRPRIALVVLCAASFLAVVDTTIVSIALPTIRDAMTLTASGSQWVLNSYALVFGGLLLLCGRLGDQLGRRRIFVSGLVVFGGGSVLAGAATEPWVLLGGRVVQGLAAAAFVPNSLSLLTATFTEGRARSRALAAYGAMAGVGFVAGMVGGGVLTQLWGWRWIFWINIPVVVLMLFPARRNLPENRGPRRRGPIDAAGGIAITVGLISLILAVTSAPHYGWLSPLTLAGGLFGLGAVLAFIALERRHAEPLVPPSVVSRHTVAAPNGAIALQSMVGVAWLFLLTLYFQDLRGLDPLVSGLAFAPMTLASVIGAALAGRSAPRLGNRRTAVIGMLGMMAGIVAMTLGVGAPEGFPAVIVGMMLGETGFMLGSVSLTIAATNSLEDRDAGLAAGLINTATQLGAGVGLGIVAAVVAATSPQLDTTDVRAGFLTCLVFGACAFFLATKIADPESASSS